MHPETIERLYPLALHAHIGFVLASVTLFAARDRWMGPMLRDWERDHSLTRRTKTMAVVSMTLMVAASAWGLQERPVLQGAVVTAGIIGVWVVLRIQTRKM